MASLINIGMSGLNASQGALATVGNNIANANTSGYSRQQIVQGSAASQQVGGVFIGTGTTLADVRRVYNSYLDAQLQTTTSLNGDAQAYLDQIGTVDKLLSDKNTGVSAALSSFFSSLQTAAAAPGDVSARQLLLTSAQTLSNRFNSISTQLNQQNEGINSQLDTLTSMVNQHTATIASLNKQIAQATTAGNTPNNLLDARNEAVRSLNELVGVTVQEHDNVYDITLGTGQSLVQGSTSNTISAVPGKVDKSQYSIQVNFQQSSSDVTSVISGGKIGGLLRYRDDVLAPAMNDLGRTAIVVADAINQQLGQGLDANGEFGSSLFNSINSATAISQRSQAATGNIGAGNFNVSIADSGALTAYDYQVTFTSATEYSVKRSDGTDMGAFATTDTPAKVIDGFTLDLKGGPMTAGDAFKVSPTRSGAGNIGVQMSDANKLAFAGPLVAGPGSSNTGTGAVGSLNLSSALDIYGGVNLGKAQSDIEGAMPVRIAFDEASADGTQSYRVLNEAGKEIGKGSIVPGQDNKVTINVPVTSADGTTTNVGFDTVISGSPGKGDSFDIKFNKDGKADNRNANELLGLQTKATVGVGKDGTGGVSMATSYSQLVSKVGGKASQAAVDGTANGAALSYAKEVRNSVSQVNLDEEASNLVKFQQYYTASSQIIKAAQATFSTLINSL